MKIALRCLGLAGLLALIACGLFFAVQTLRPRTLALDLPGDVRPGDVILMRSHTWRAELVRLIDGVPYRDGFSHVGIVSDRADGVWHIVHAVLGADGTVRREAWPSVARGGGISEAISLRADMTEAQRTALIGLLADAAERAVAFDGRFDHHDPETLYCTELVSWGFAQAGHPVIGADILAKRAIFPGHLAGSQALARLTEMRKDRG